MKRLALIMRLKPGCEDEYRKRHDEIWPDLAALLTDVGIRDYSIYLDRKAATLFATLKLADENSFDDLPSTSLMKKWWAYMADIMETNPDRSPITQPLEEVFHME